MTLNKVTHKKEIKVSDNTAGVIIVALLILFSLMTLDGSNGDDMLDATIKYIEKDKQCMNTK